MAMVVILFALTFILPFPPKKSHRKGDAFPVRKRGIGRKTAGPSCGNRWYLLSSRLSLLVLELHQIMRITRADCTANREFHPAPKTLLFSCFLAIITSTTFGSNELKKVRKHFGNHLILSYSFSYETKSVSGILRWSCLSVSAASSFP